MASGVNLYLGLVLEEKKKRISFVDLISVDNSVLLAPATHQERYCPTNSL